jgi:ATP-dependent Clp protease ATP-binding subunit ClpC
MEKRTKKPPDEIIAEWLDRDLSAAAADGGVPTAFEVDDHVARLHDVVLSGRHPIVTGESGVGKTAIVYELVRRTSAGQGPEPLVGKRILEFALRKRIATLAKPEHLKPEFAKLVDALLTKTDVVPFFRDLDIVFDFDLEPLLELLAAHSNAPIIGEGNPRKVDGMFEAHPQLEQHYVVLPVEEPNLDATERILTAWRLNEESNGSSVDADALTEALHLTHRFLPRTRHPRKSIEFLKQVRSLVSKTSSVAAHDVIERFHRVYRVPLLLIDPSVSFDLNATERQFRSRVLGQSQAVRAVVRMISVIKAGLTDSRRPFGAFLFVGPTGVGKTHLAQLLAEFLFGSRDRMVRFNMADYQTPHDALKLFGNPEAYHLRDKRGGLTASLIGHPFAVLLLDEFEKAAPQIHDRFLQLVDEGQFINGALETVSCRSLIIIATSNAGAEVYRSRSIGFAGDVSPKELEKELERRLYQHFRIEFLNRFDQVVHFHPLNRDAIRAIALREVELLCDRAGLKTRALEVEVDELLLDWLTAHGYDPMFGARFLRRTIERNVTTALAEAIVRETLSRGTRIALRVRGGRVVASVVDRKKEPTHETRVPHGTGEKAQKLDREGVLQQSAELLARAAPLLEELESRREEASGLLEHINAPSFWDNADDARQTLERYRDLDVAIQLGDRCSESLRWLAELHAHAMVKPRRLDELARNINRAAQSLRRWEDHLAEEGPGALWLLLRDVVPLQSAAEWIEALAKMELAWCHHLHLTAAVVAYGSSDEGLDTVVIEVEGPGAATYLAMEHGMHRLHRPEGGDLRVRIDVITKGAPTDKPPMSERVPRHHHGALGISVAHRAILRWGDRGVALDLSASSRDALAQLMHDLEHAPSMREGEIALARSYADSGAGARDPRTGEVVPRYRDVMKGKLDRLLEAWRASKLS